MRLGFIGGYDEKTLAFAQKAGFEGLEIHTKTGSELFNKDTAKKVKAAFDKHDLAVISMFHFEDYCSGDKMKDAAAFDSFLKTIEISDVFNTKVITCNAFAGKVSEDEQLKNFERIFGEFAKAAEDSGKLIGIENCPHGGRNVGYSPVLWKKMFEIVPPVVGLEFDPSHLHWMGIDWLQAIYDFADRIHMFHAKDTEIRRNRLKVAGIEGRGWWRYRLPGWGEINWKQIFTALLEIGYTGDMVIEHEDPVYDGELREKGLEMGLRTLQSCN
ncbi:sugar phosphate isomerase/epimerase [candidate division KSB1 bacterium]|nr:sugar phosphate isomerase/epimerase [candidate division KSB1 bacterium]